MPSFIDDGYTRDDGYIAAAPADEGREPIHGDLEFTYRVSTRREWIPLDAAVDKELKKQSPDPVKIEMLACEFVASHIKEWSLKNRGGHDVPVTAENVMGLQVTLFNRLYQIIRGNDTSDPKPGSDAKPKSDGEMLGNSVAVSG